MILNFLPAHPPLSQGRWRILQQGIQGDQQLCGKVTYSVMLLHNFALADLAPTHDNICDAVVAEHVRHLTYDMRGAAGMVWSELSLAMSHTKDLALADTSVALSDGPSSVHRAPSSLGFEPVLTALRLRNAAELYAGKARATCQGRPGVVVS